MNAKSSSRAKTVKTADKAVVLPPFVDQIPRLGILAWSFIGVVLAASFAVTALAAVSSIVLPMTFAAVLAICFKPFGRWLIGHKFKPGLAAGLVVLGLIALMVGIVVVSVRGVIDQSAQISALSDAAADQVSELTIAL